MDSLLEERPDLAMDANKWFSERGLTSVKIDRAAISKDDCIYVLCRDQQESVSEFARRKSLLPAGFNNILLKNNHSYYLRYSG
jgi:hypothetical protein